MLFRSWFLFFLFQPPVSSTGFSIREICEINWTSPILEIRKTFENGLSAKFNPLKVHDLQNAISVSQFTISKDK